VRFDNEGSHSFIAAINEPIDLFSPIDLYEEKNVPKVVRTVSSFERAARKAGFKIVIKHITELDYSDEQLMRAQMLLQKADPGHPQNILKKMEKEEQERANRGSIEYEESEGEEPEEEMEPEEEPKPVVVEEIKPVEPQLPTQAELLTEIKEETKEIEPEPQPGTIDTECTQLSVEEQSVIYFN
jgi:hypothetical protein